MRIAPINSLNMHKIPNSKVTNTFGKTYDRNGDIFFKGSDIYLNPNTEYENLNTDHAGIQNFKSSDFVHYHGSYCVNNSNIYFMEGRKAPVFPDKIHLDVKGKSKIYRLLNFSTVNVYPEAEINRIEGVRKVSGVRNPDTNPMPAPRLDSVKAFCVDLQNGCKSEKISTFKARIEDNSSNGTYIKNLDSFSLFVSGAKPDSGRRTVIENIKLEPDEDGLKGDAEISFCKTKNLICKTLFASDSQIENAKCDTFAKIKNCSFGILDTNSLPYVSNCSINKLIYGRDAFIIEGVPDTKFGAIEFKNPDGILILKNVKNKLSNVNVINGKKKYELEDFKADNLTLDAPAVMKNVEIENLTVTEPNTSITLEGNSNVKNVTFKYGGEVILKKDENGVHPAAYDITVANGKLKRDYELKGLEKVAGMDELKQQLKDDVIEPLKNPELYNAYGIGVINGVLLYGPPGCGKTFIAQQLAEETGRYFVEITPADVGSTYMHKTAKNIRTKFNLAAANSPSIVFIDEVESLAPNRNELSQDNSDYNEMVTELLMQLNNSKNKDVFVLLASNEPQKIDRAIKRTGRMDKRIFVGPPDYKTRKELFIGALEKVQKKQSDIDCDKLAKITPNYTAKDIELLVREACICALKQKADVSNEHLLQAKNKVLPYLTDEVVEQYKMKGKDNV